MKRTEVVTRTLVVEVESPAVSRVVVPDSGPAIVSVTTSGPSAGDCGPRLALFRSAEELEEAAAALSSAAQFMATRDRASQLTRKEAS